MMRWRHGRRLDCEYRSSDKSGQRHTIDVVHVAGRVNRKGNFTNFFDGMSNFALEKQEFEVRLGNSYFRMFKRNVVYMKLCVTQ